MTLSASIPDVVGQFKAFLLIFWIDRSIVAPAAVSEAGCDTADILILFIFATTPAAGSTNLGLLFRLIVTCCVLATALGTTVLAWAKIIGCTVVPPPQRFLWNAA